MGCDHELRVLSMGFVLDGGFTAASMYANNPELQGETMKGGEAGAPAGASVKGKVTIDDLQKYVPEFVLREFAGRREHVRAPHMRSRAYI